VQEIERFFAFDRHVQERVSTRREPFAFGVAFFDDDLPERYSSNFLLVDRRFDRLTADALIGAAERILGAAGLRHRLLVVNDAGAAQRLIPALSSCGYRASSDVVMSHRRTPDRSGSVVAEEVPFDGVRGLIREMFRRRPLPDDLANRYTDQEAKKERTIGARYFVADVDGERAGDCVLYLDGPDAQVEDVGTLEEYRGRGVARAVVLRAVEAAREAGARHVFIVTDENDWPKELYRRLGFDPIGRTTDLLLTAAIDAQGVHSAGDRSG
jgi:GNAT superfamily N-acetyltransferase